MVQIQQVAPQFQATAVVDGCFQEVKLSDFAGQYVVLLFYPLDFTFVCPTELVAFSERISEFTSMGAQVLGISVDSQFTHLAFNNTPRNQGGLGGLKYPLVSDITKNICRQYSTLIEEAGVAARGLFIIDPQQKVRIKIINDLPVGRSVDETLRLLEAVKFTDEHGMVCPANWKRGENAIKPNLVESKEYFNNQSPAQTNQLKRPPTSPLANEEKRAR
ncbi:thioredoxin-like protein [Basidiobolus meristosporus CBS 931.73]|uniref:thioredoxin-dependent peroxiredoxin n=1 Tax=Basidiobolus meristosporus CBS 931.73 TaxID=1314790 RepID=A0A1Y1XEW7_9FUNG|nr:thioredoxin-like protein [Basidiobolus meristosporus CBS 931.73]ORY08144.1 thioredoxin-like protein [Basidiobolus meristosporus CBS 931.73]|eukprot:ORX84310.1 thioredoxin-like protein [Basidiobolus meristosporus CBS 931.73]